ncbi:MAG: HAD-IA family hydrolase [Candidatus Babeliales bacterium]
MNSFRKLAKNSIALSLMVWSLTLNPATVIFDMDGVLVTQSRFWQTYHIGFSKFFWMYDNPSALKGLKGKLFDFLDRVEPRKEETPKAFHEGKLLPQLMCDWQCGLISQDDILKKIAEGFEAHKDFFSSSSQKDLYIALYEFMFTPKKMIKGMYPVKDAVKLAKKCAKSLDKEGNKNRVFILTNWDSQSFELMKKKHKSLRSLFKYCSGVVVSGDAGMMKPDPALYEYLCSTHNVDPEKEIVAFIDDTPCNVQTAQDCGMHGIHCKDLNIKAVKKELHALGIV